MKLPNQSSDAPRLREQVEGPTKKTILWQSRAPRLFESVREGALDRQANGGNAYDYHAIDALSRAFDVRLDEEAVRRNDESVLGYWWRIRRHRGSADVVIKEPSLVSLGPLGDAPIEVAIIHHISFDLWNKSPGHHLFFSRLVRRLPQIDAVVTVSNYWRRELEKLGCRRVEVIHNAFDPSEFEISDTEIAEFRARVGLNENRPLIYIGNGGAKKGVYEVYEALKDEGYTLVTTGSRQPDLPVRWFSLTRRDYLRLMAACDVVISMSHLLEGWSRVVHEAMLCRTPVIGSGAGGMRELLEGGGQMVLTEARNLPDAVRSVLEQKEEKVQKGYRFARQFDSHYFTEAWTGLAERLTAASKQPAVRAA